jgi:hypothetical protein
MLGRPPFLRTSDTPGKQNPPHGRSRQVDPLFIRQFLGEVLLIKSVIFVPGQLNYLLPQPFLNYIDRLITPIAMGYR